MNRRQQARKLLERARSGELPIEDFARSWPEQGDPLVDAIFEETEDTVEHVPGSLLGGTNRGRFEGSPGYKMLIIDEQFLADDLAGVDSARLLQMRTQFLPDVDLNEEASVLAAQARKFIAQALERSH